MESEHIPKGDQTREEIFRMPPKRYIVVENITHKKTSSRFLGRKQNPYTGSDRKQYIQAAATK
ncbi:hypothetical protein C922_05271 [Plasmodium inui San Antonio 1]|uniref:Uncharacterized protein n=1 Tax=Plasmodium inui San Antonio 1 TaxID=1237626 RepID=W6ZTU5_9APIC|nr:hypothetical protein C922_05271 [Plasmodium inui San Antonio 1]EUD64352.1 hypothetical protein C922_05271 [Plasmodium inui San Antonio 1]